MNKNAMKYRFEQSAEGNTHKLYIYDDVTAYGHFNWETWQYEDSETGAKYFRKKLEEIPETGAIELHINSNGGSVKEGVAIYNLLKQHKATKTCYVDGFAYSIASVICMACDKIIMGKGTSMLIHNMSMDVYGDAKMLRKCADDLDVLMDANRKIYMERVKNLTEEQLKEMMDKETFLTPEQCLEYGFCDEIGGQTAEEKNMTQQMQAMVQQMRQELDGFQSFRQEMKQLVQGEKKPETPKTPEAVQKGKEEKVLNAMNALLNAFDRERRKTN